MFISEIPNSILFSTKYFREVKGLEIDNYLTNNHPLAMSGTNSILFVDAYDSFSNNIVALLHSSIPNADIVVVHIDTDILDEYHVDNETFISSFDAIVLGPGPGHPANKADVGLFEDVWRYAEQHQIAVLGICLGFQTLCIRNGYKIARMHMPCHGQTKRLRTSNLDIFANLKDICAMNYNSLAVRTTEFELEDNHSRPGSSGTDSSTCSGHSDFASIGSSTEPKAGRLQLLAWDDDGYVMAVRHRFLPFWGFQFHPESCMSQGGDELIKRWWMKTEQYNEMCGSQSRTTRTFQQRQNPQNLTPMSSGTLSTSCGRVSWQMLKVKSLKSSDISDLCYKSSSKSTTAMLESTAKGRFSIYAFTDNISELLTYHNSVLTCKSSNRLFTTSMSSPSEALGFLEKKLKASACVGGCPKIPFWGGLIGYVSYEMGLDLINVSSERSRDVPDFNFVWTDRNVVFDNQTNDVCIQSILPGDEEWIHQMKTKIKTLDKEKSMDAKTRNGSKLSQILKSAKKHLPDHDHYTSLIRECQENLHAGQSYELCLTSEATIDLPNPCPETPYNLYKNLRKHNPVPYAAYLHFPNTSAIPDQNLENTILSSSPELFLSQSRTGTMDMIPMKGTVQRTPTTTIQDAMKTLYTPKETAENLMIADLIRHDLYAVIGTKPYPYFTASPDPTKQPSYNSQTHTSTSSTTIKNNLIKDPLSIPALNTIQTYETVYQLTSHIRAHPPPHLQPSSSSSISDPHVIIPHNHAALHHTLPPGSMTGAPKKRSCEILRDLEQRNRGVYSGVIGYMCVSGGACWSVAIRTAWSTGWDEYQEHVGTVKGEDGAEAEEQREEEVVKEGWRQTETNSRKVWHVGAGGAVTVLSDVEGEWEEMMGKMRNVVKGLTVPS